MTGQSQSSNQSAFKRVFVSKTDKVLHQFLRYIWVGATTTVIDLVIMNFMFVYLGSSEVLSASVGYMVGVVANYFLCITWIFESDKSRRMYEFLGSMAIGFIGLGLNDLIIWLGVNLLPKWGLFCSTLDMVGVPQSDVVFLNVAKGISIVTVLAWNFLARKYIIFRKRPTNMG